MCTLEPDEYAKVWNEAPRIARKEHTCDACCSAIPKGSAYLHHSSLYDEHWTTEAMCFPCWWVREAFAQDHRYTPVPSQLMETLRECIDGRLPAAERSAPTDWAPELASVLRRYRTSKANRRRLERKREEQAERESVVALSRKRFPWCRVGRVELRKDQHPEVTLLFGEHMFATWEGRSTVSMPPNAVSVWRSLEAAWLAQAWENEGSAQLSPVSADN